MQQNTAGSENRHLSENHTRLSRLAKNRRRFMVCLWSVALLAMLGLPMTTHASPRCEIYVTVENTGTKPDYSFSADWQQSQFRASGVWHAVCGRNGRPKCTKDSSPIAPGASAQTSFRTVTGSCNQIRTVKIQLDSGQLSDTAVCAVPAEYGGSQRVTIKAKWNASGLSYTCVTGQ